MKSKVLVVDDSSTSVRVVSHLIKKADKIPISVFSLAQALDVLNDQASDEFLCAVVDYTLPDAPRGEAIEAVLKYNIPVIVITGRLDNNTREQILNKPVVDYIPKQNAQVYEYLTRLIVRLERNSKIGILVVDDSLLSRNAAVNLLKRHNFITYEAKDGIEGLEILNKNPGIKMVLTDENMPNMSGLEMLVALRKNFKKDDLAVIGMSSEGPSFLSARFIKSGANDYLNRPYCHEEFFCCVTQNIENIENIEAIRRAANSDYLTGLPNRRYFFHRLENTTPSAQDCVALIDLDFFKKVNDTFGHEGGDQVLKDVARLLASHFSQHLIARFGGEEFCVYFQNTPVEQAKASLEEFRIAFSERASWINQQPIKCTTSIGLSNKFEGEIDGMISFADLALYQAKQLGRNQIVVDELQANTQII
ncbi:MAG: GGDEF domain-containing response regulator [Paraglaciecola chathamensis]